jgi:hypothetical protein
MLVLPVLRVLRQENWEFKAILGYAIRPCLKNKTKQNKKTKHPSQTFFGFIYLNKVVNTKKNNVIPNMQSPC